MPGFRPLVFILCLRRVSASCAADEYATTFTCKPCHSTCATCDGGDANDCLSCGGSYPVYYAGYFGEYCYECAADNDCSTGSSCFSDYTCQVCNAACLTCSTLQADGCTSCGSGKYLDSGVLTSGGSCSSCDATCGECNGGNPWHCTSCDALGSNPHFFDGYAGDYCYECMTSQDCKASESCLDDYSCKQCGGSCLTCRNLKSDGCLTCPSSRYLNVGMLASSGECDACHSTCGECNGAQPWHCTSCDLSGAYPHFYDGYSGDYCYQCLSTSDCNTGESCLEDKNCAACQHNCSTCSTLQNDGCLSCPSGFYLSAGLLASSGKCLPCNPTCGECDGGEAWHCTACDPNGSHPFFYDGYNGDYCYQCFTTEDCSDGKSCIEDYTCSDCHENCSTCRTTHGDGCLTCHAGKYLDASLLSLSGYCSPCADSCGECDGSKEWHCKSCAEDGTTPHFYDGYTGDYCYQCLQSSHCASTERCFSPSAYQCGVCHASCAECAGPTAQECTECPLQYFLNTWASSVGECMPCANHSGSFVTKFISTSGQCGGGTMFAVVVIVLVLFVVSIAMMCLSFYITVFDSLSKVVEALWSCVWLPCTIVKCCRRCCRLKGQQHEAPQPQTSQPRQDSSIIGSAVTSNQSGEHDPEEQAAQNAVAVELDGPVAKAKGIGSLGSSRAQL